jgi:hypothetical protein
MYQAPAQIAHRLRAWEKRLATKRSRGESPSQVLRDSCLTLFSITTELTREMCSSATLAFADHLITRHLPAPQSWHVGGDLYERYKSAEWTQSSRSATARVSHYSVRLESRVSVSGLPSKAIFSLELELSRLSILRRLCDRVISSRTSYLT